MSPSWLGAGMALSGKDLANVDPPPRGRWVVRGFAYDPVRADLMHAQDGLRLDRPWRMVSAPALAWCQVGGGR